MNFTNRRLVSVSELRERLAASLAGLEDCRPKLVERLKAFLAAERGKVYEMHRRGAGGIEVCASLAAIADAVILFVHDYALRRMETKGHGAEKPLAWLAVGGYGRGLLNPFSDVDVMVLHPGEISPYLEDMVSTAFHLFWDTGLEVSHSCRSIAETQKVMREDSWIATSVLESRCLAGDQALYEQFKKEVVADFLAKNRYPYVEQKIAEAEKRHKSEGGSVYLTEPNVKESAGGLRDMNMVFWMGTALAGDAAAARVPGLVEPDERQMARAMKAYGLQLRIRTEMHLRAGRRSEVLDRGTQADIAAAFGYKDTDSASALSAFMRDYLLAAREVNGLLRTLVSRFRYLRRIQHGTAARVGRRVLERDFVAVGDRVFLGRNDLFDGPGGLRHMMRVFLCSQRHRLGVSEETLEHIRHQLHRVDDAFRQDPEVAAMFMEILRGASGVADTLQAMAESGLLGEYLPEFGELDCLVHYEAYHDYTVDEHTLMSIRTIDELPSASAELDRSKRAVLTQVTRPCLLKLALLLHDIGKPRGSEHTERGATMIPLIAKQLSLPEPDGKLVMFLVENHLAMADLSQRRDFNEEGVLREFAAKVGSLTQLQMLYLMTYADIKSMGRGAWAAWKDSLLWELYEKTAALLSKAPRRDEAVEPDFRHALLSILPRSITREEAERHCDRVPPRYAVEVTPEEAVAHLRLIQRLKDEPMSVSFSFTDAYVEMWLCTGDMPARFSQIAGTFVGNGVNIISAQAFTRKDGIILDRFRLSDAGGKVITAPEFWERVKEDLSDVLQGKKSVADMVKARQRRMAFRKVVPQPGVTRIHIDNKSSPEYTILDLTTWDRIGLLYAVTNCLSESGLDIHFSKISTRLNLAVDVFYVTDKTTRAKVEDQGRLAQITKALTEIGEKFGVSGQ